MSWRDRSFWFDLATPCYVYDPEAVVAAWSRLRERLGTGVVVSLKANPNVDLLERCALAFRDGIEVASLGELELVHGRTAGPRFVNTPGLSEGFCQAAIRSRAILVIDNPDQLHVLRREARGASVHPILLRLNAGSLAPGACRQDAFGTDVATATEMAVSAEKSGLKIGGLHVFAGSHSWPDGCEALLSPVASAAAHIEQAISRPLTTINLGGGFAAGDAEDSVRMEGYRSMLAPMAKSRSLLHESGRALYQRAGAFLVSVLAVKQLGDRTIVVCDGGLPHNFLLCGTETPLRRPAAPRLLPRGGGPRGKLVSKAVLAGPSCNRADQIGVAAAGDPCPLPGDRYLFEDCGAYNATYSPTGFLGLTPALQYISFPEELQT